MVRGLEKEWNIGNRVLAGGMYIDLGEWKQNVYIFVSPADNTREYHSGEGTKQPNRQNNLAN